MLLSQDLSILASKMKKGCSLEQPSSYSQFQLRQFALAEIDVPLDGTIVLVTNNPATNNAIATNATFHTEPGAFSFSMI